MDFDLELFLFLILHEKQSSMSPLEYSSQGKTENSHLLSIYYAHIIDHYIYMLPHLIRTAILLN